MRILFVSTVGRTMGFFNSLFCRLLEDGNEVVVACGDSDEVPEEVTGMGIEIVPLSCSRNPFASGNFRAIGELRSIVENGNYDLIHCHTPIASACARFACRNSRKKGLSVVYTAHGFHFYDGAPLRNWLLFYPIEWIASYLTDTLVTINREDYSRAKQRFHARETVLVPGVGVDFDRFQPKLDRYWISREELGISRDEFLILSVGELNENKNHEEVIKAIAPLIMEQGYNIKYLVAGRGPLESYLSDLSRQAKIEDSVRLLGYRGDTPTLYAAADLFVFPSFREGLPVSVMEALASGNDVISSNCRGCVDLISKEFQFSPSDPKELCIKIKNIIDPWLKDADNRGKKKPKLSARYSDKEINEIMIDIYKKTTFESMRAS